MAPPKKAKTMQDPSSDAESSDSHNLKTTSADAKKSSASSSEASKPGALRKPGAFKTVTRSTAAAKPLPLLSSDSSTDSDSDPGTLMATPDPIENEFSLGCIVDPGEVNDQEKVNHAKYLELARRRGVYGWQQMAELAYAHEEKIRSHFMRQCSRLDWMVASDSTLLTTEPLVLDAITTRYGNINQLYHASPVAKTASDCLELRSSEHEHPAIYVRALTHDAAKDFQAFTYQEAFTIANYASIYASSVTKDTKQAYTDIAFIVDQKYSAEWRKSSSAKGQRYFLQTKKGDTNNRQRARQLKTFARVLHKSATECRDNGFVTVPVMHYVGYAVNAGKQREDHLRGGRGSSWLMQCVVHIAKAAGFSVFIDSITVALVDEEKVAPIAEMLLTRIARAYYFAGGFSLAQAGTSLEATHQENRTDQELEVWWKGHRDWIQTLPDYEQRMADELKRRNAFRTSGITAEREAKEDAYNAFVEEMAQMNKTYKECMERMGDDEARKSMFDYGGRVAVDSGELRKYIEETEKKMSEEK